MTQHLLVHCTRAERLAAVLRDGLRPHRPRDNNYPEAYDDEPRVDEQPIGIYATPIGRHPWREHDPLLLFPYCGPLEPDPLIRRAVVIRDAIPQSVLRRVDYDEVLA